jgi:pimeloyl-ACP methyl ester carboxylesterase
MKKVLAVLLVLMVIAGFWIFEGDYPAAEVDARYSNVASAFLDLPDGSRMHYRDQGNAAGLPVVLVHGSNASLHTWEAWASLLGDTYRIVTLDLPGHGLTGRTTTDDYSSAAFINATKALVQYLQIDSFVLGGNSMGGGVTWRYALSFPDDVKAMVLVDASGPQAWRQRPQAESSGDAPWAFSLLRKAWFQKLARYIDPYYLVVQGLQASHYDAAVVTDALIDRYYELSMRAGTREATIRRFSGWRDGGSEKVEDLSVLTQPTLILWGEHDAVIPVAVANRFQATLPNARTIIYPHVGHIPMEEIPQRSADDVRAFLTALNAETDQRGI